MNLEEAIRLAHSSQPETMQKVAQSMAILEKLAPEFTVDVVSDFQKIANVCDSKLAAVSALSVGAAIGTAAAVGLGTALAGDLYDAAKRGLTKGRNFKRIMDSNPQLHEFTDKSKLRMVYDSLHRYAPEFTADPLVGGSMMTNLMNSPETSASIIANTIKGRKDLIDSRNNQFRLPSFAEKVMKAHDKADHAGPPKMKTT
jgi:hypothetical protein